MEDGRIAANITTVTIHPKERQVEIIQEGLFTVIQSEKDTTLVLAQWDQLYNWKERNISWDKELDSFPVKSLTFQTIKDTIQPLIRLSYSSEKDLRVLGIWYNKEKNQYSVNHVTKHNVKTTDGALVGNYWVFNGEHSFSFSMEPFLQLPEQYQKLKQPLHDLLKE